MANYPKTEKKERTTFDNIKTGLHHDKGSDIYTLTYFHERWGAYITATVRAKSRKEAEELINLMTEKGDLY